MKTVVETKTKKKELPSVLEQLEASLEDLRKGRLKRVL